MEKFYSKISRETECWVWTASKFKSGYGQFRFNGKTRRAHRVSFEIHKGPIPYNMNILHNCPGGDNRACVNPEHLWLGTQQENMRDKVSKGRDRQSTKTHCLRGHELTGENTYIKKTGRECKMCKRLHHEKAYTKKKSCTANV